MENSEPAVVKDIKDLTTLVPNVFENVIIYIRDGKHVLDLPTNMIGDMFRKWKKTRGGIFSRDLLRFLRGKDNAGKYVLIEKDGYRTVARLIEEEEELLMFKSLKLVDGNLKDVPYMILRTVPMGEKLTNFYRNNPENVVHVEDPEEKIVAINKPADHDDEENLPHGEALFED